MLMLMLSMMGNGDDLKKVCVDDDDDDDDDDLVDCNENNTETISNELLSFVAILERGGGKWCVLLIYGSFWKLLWLLQRS